MKTRDAFTAGESVAQIFERSADAQAAANRLRSAGFADVRISERCGRTSESHVDPAAGATEVDFAAVLENAGFAAGLTRELTRAIAGGAALLTVAGGGRSADALAVLRGETVAGRPLGPIEPAPAGNGAAPVAPVVAGEGAAPVAPVVAGEGAAPVAPVVVGEGAAPVAPARTGAGEPGDRVIALREERLDVTKERTTGEARVRKEVVTEHKTITVPVQREQLVVERDGEEPVRIPLGESAP